MLRRRIAQFLAEPLVHFVVLGAAIFAIFSWVSDEKRNDKNTIVVTQAKLENLVNTFSRAWQHPPSETELQALIQDYVKEEIAVREAVALGLDRNDSVIRRLLRQKLEFVTEDQAEQDEPSENELKDYFTSHADAFRSEPRLSFSQIYFNQQRPDPQLTQTIAQELAQLNHNQAPVDVAARGDVTSLAHQFNEVTPSQIKQIFGEAFADAILALEPNQWVGPIVSGYGQHLVRVSKHTPGDPPEFAQIRDEIRRAWLNNRRAIALDQFYATRLKKYSVSLETPELAKPTFNPAHAEDSK